MYLRTTRQRRQHGPDALDDQLADNSYHQERRRSETRVISTFGRADQVDPQALRRLAQSLRRVANDDGLALSVRKFPPDLGSDDIEQVYAYGVLYAARAVWEELGIGPLLREKRQQDGCDAPHETAWRAMTANRLARPASKLACYEPWLADEGYGPEAKALALEPRDRARAFLLRHLASLEQEIFLRTADRFNADGDWICWDTTSRYFELDAKDDASELWQDRPIPALRPRGHHQEGRDGTPQVVIGLALPRDGWPVRSWVFPGHTAAVPTINHLKDDLQGWRVHRCVFVGDRGRVSEAHRQRLSRALGRSMLAVPRRKVTEVQRHVLTRAGRSRDVAHTLRVQAGYVGEGERRRRSLVCHNPDAAAREQTPRERLLTLVRAALASLATRQADHPKTACALLASRRCGRDLRMDVHGRLRINAAKGAAEAPSDGKFVVTTNDATRDAEDGALGYTSMPRIEGCFRQMKTTGLPTRPISHGRAPRIIAHGKRCGLALLRARAAEIRCPRTWRTMRQTLDPVTVVRDRMHGKTIVQSTPVSAPRAEILQRLGMPLPKKRLEVCE
jgi:hypothetical protein